MQRGAGDEHEDVIGSVREPFVHELHELLVVTRPRHRHRDHFEVVERVLQDVRETLPVRDAMAEGEAVSEGEDPGLARRLQGDVLLVPQSLRVRLVGDHEVGSRDDACIVGAQRSVGVAPPVAGQAERDLREPRHRRGVEPVVEALDPSQDPQAGFAGGENEEKTPDDERGAIEDEPAKRTAAILRHPASPLAARRISFSRPTRVREQRRIAMRRAVIVEAVRTPIGKRSGALCRPAPGRAAGRSADRGREARGDQPRRGRADHRRLRDAGRRAGLERDAQRLALRRACRSRWRRPRSTASAARRSRPTT